MVKVNKDKRDLNDDLEQIRRFERGHHASLVYGIVIGFAIGFASALVLMNY